MFIEACGRTLSIDSRPMTPGAGETVSLRGLLIIDQYVTSRRTYKTATAILRINFRNADLDRKLTFAACPAVGQDNLDLHWREHLVGDR